MLEKKDLGDLGEKIAREYLENKGYKILDKNFRYSKLGELDIIATKNGDIIFFEVKTRLKTGLSDFLPEDNITLGKQKKLVKLAQIYLGKHPAAARQANSWQIDILAIETYKDQSHDIRHIENAVCDMY